ncbi:MAG: acyl-ACP--UDP-N-acetylglucosamine O-acyltransferase [Candidatus Calescibacterium sp.]|nr:acyl-ACP--UDP-N-acetylglucosamine O-acyltransferase [Candidatus Calescibacterium sp.]MDW8087539.1 acyl-ACP--UDP-N-acetylglucosamine O-acyltransferase [Candidatus Calescibacterium sp.]
MKKIHPTARISDSAFIEDNVYIGENSEIGEETYIGYGAYIGPNVKIGMKNKIYPYAVVGTPPQHLDHKESDTTYVEIGDENIIREFATIHSGTVVGGGVTRIGNKNYIMAYAHVGHDSKVGNGCVLTSFCALAGHSEVGDRTVFGGFSGTHQFVRVGKFVMIGAASFPAKDVPPFVLVAGVEARIAGLNLVGLRRAGVPSSEIEKLKEAFRIYVASDEKIEQVAEIIKQIDPSSQYICEFYEFLVSKSKRGFLKKHLKDEMSVR